MTQSADNKETKSILDYVSQIAASYLANNKVEVEEIPHLLNTLQKALQKLEKDENNEDFKRPEPAIQIDKSVTSDHIICLEDGKKLKMLKRHLKTAYNMTPEMYRKRWDLPSDYPMVAPNYAKKRSSLAKQIGLGTATSKNKH